MSNYTNTFSATMTVDTILGAQSPAVEQFADFLARGAQARKVVEARMAIKRAEEASARQLAHLMTSIVR